VLYRVSAYRANGEVTQYIQGAGYDSALPPGIPAALPSGLARPGTRGCVKLHMVGLLWQYGLRNLPPYEEGSGTSRYSHLPRAYADGKMLDLQGQQFELLWRLLEIVPGIVRV